jgi:hypothetical protein
MRSETPLRKAAPTFRIFIGAESWEAKWRDDVIIPRARRPRPFFDDMDKKAMFTGTAFQLSGQEGAQMLATVYRCSSISFNTF